MEKRSNTIVADSSGLISLLVQTDSNHDKAHDIAKQLGDEKGVVLIPSEVLAETLNILGKKFGHQQASEAIDGMLQSAAFLATPSSDIARRDALAMFRDEPASVSYTDCLVMTTAEQHGTIDIFGFDEIFMRRGFFLPGNRTKAA
jgi:predicted nucleic acid-binding protein